MMEKLQTKGQSKLQENIHKFRHYKFNINHVQTVSCSTAKKLKLLPLKLHESLTTIIMLPILETIWLIFNKANLLK